MFGTRFTGAVITVLLVGLVAASGAFGATPSQIYKDYAQHGKLTHPYSKSDLQRALRSAVVRGYGHGHAPGLKVAGKRAGTGPPPVKPSGGLPFTGMDLGLITFGGVLLLAFGAVFRRLGRVHR